MTVLKAYQKAVYDALKADATLLSLVTQTDGTLGIYEYFPEVTAKLPFIIFAQSQETPEYCMGSSGSASLLRVSLTIEVWSDAPSRKEALAILDELETALNVDMTLEKGTALHRPMLTLKRAEPDPSLGFWRIPIEAQCVISM
jgi:hypothetical protein